MANGDGGVAGYALAEQKQTSRFPDDKAATKDDCSFSLSFHTRTLNQLKNAGWSACDEGIFLLLAHAADVGRVETVHVFRHGHLIENCGFVDVPG